MFDLITLAEPEMVSTLLNLDSATQYTIIGVLARIPGKHKDTWAKIHAALS